MANPGIERCHKNKNKMYNLFLEITCAYNESKYKTYRNKLNHILKKAEKQHYTDLLTANKNNIKNLMAR